MIFGGSSNADGPASVLDVRVMFGSKPEGPPRE